MELFSSSMGTVSELWFVFVLFSMCFKLSNTIEIVPERKDYVFPVKKLLNSDLGTKAQR